MQSPSNIILGVKSPRDSPLQGIPQYSCQPIAILQKNYRKINESLRLNLLFIKFLIESGK